MKILVTGGNGFLGSWIVKGLISRGDSVRVLHRKTSDMSALKGVKYESALGDVTNFESLKLATRGIDAVIHAAAVIAYSPKDRLLMEKVNIEGTANTARAAREGGVKKFVHTSSVVAIGASNDKKILNEDSPYTLGRFQFGYYETKRRAEEEIRKAVAQGLDACMVNPSVMFGAGDAVKNSRRVHMKVAAGKFPFYPPGGVNIAHVADVVEGHILALDKGKSGERYILGSENVTVKELFNLLAQAGGHKPPRIPIPRKLLQVGFFAAGFLSRKYHLPVSQSDQAFLSTLYHWYDISKAKRELGYNPRPAAQAIEESVSWAKAHGYI